MTIKIRPRFLWRLLIGKLRKFHEHSSQNCVLCVVCSTTYSTVWIFCRPLSLTYLKLCSPSFNITHRCLRLSQYLNAIVILINNTTCEKVCNTVLKLYVFLQRTQQQQQYQIQTNTICKTNFIFNPQRHNTTTGRWDTAPYKCTRTYYSTTVNTDYINLIGRMVDCLLRLSLVVSRNGDQLTIYVFYYWS